MSRYDDLRKMREAKFVAKAVTKNQRTSVTINTPVTENVTLNTPPKKKKRKSEAKKTKIISPAVGRNVGRNRESGNS